MSYIPLSPDFISSGNSSTTPLTSGQVFTGAAIDLEAQPIDKITAQVFSDQPSATNGFAIQFSTDNVSWDAEIHVSVSANQGSNIVVGVIARYARVVYTNGGTNQGVFRLQTNLSQLPSVLPLLNLSTGGVAAVVAELTLDACISSNKVAVTDALAESSLATLAGCTSAGKVNVALTGTTTTADTILDATVVGGKVTTADTILDGCVASSKLAVRAAAGDVVVEVSDGTNVIGTNTHPVRVDPTGTTKQPVSAAVGDVVVEVSDGTNVIGTSAHPVKTDPTGTTTQPVVLGVPTTSQMLQAAVSFSGSGDNVLVAAVGGQTIRIWRLMLVVGAATNLTIKDSTPTNFSGAMPLSANGSLGLGFEGDPYFVTGVGKAFELNSSNAVQVSGTVWYTQS